MRLLICQTPKLSYVKIIALLQREAEAVPFDLVLLPETAMEHPLQCTDQGTLSFENVGLQMLSQLAREMKFYLVLGSIAERTAKGMLETCFVMGRLGEVVMRYRKHTIGAPTEELDDGQPAVFDTDFGTVGLLMGEEVKDEGRWTKLLARKPCIVLNPTNSLPQLDSSLAKAHPELQVSAWHKAFRQLERQVAAQTWRRPCALVRADAPLHEGGAGTSALVDLHRTVLPAGWGPCFICVEVNTKGKTPSSRLPGWRQKTIEERIEEVAWNNAHRPQRRMQLGADDSEAVGPRYTIWTLPLPQTQPSVLRHHEEWRMGSRRRKSPLEALARRLAAGERCFMVPIAGQDDRPLCAVVSRAANMAVWDLQPKREMLTSNLGEGVTITAVGCSRNKQEFVVAGMGHGALLFRVFDAKGPAAGLAVHLGQLPWTDWRLPLYTSEERTDSVVGHANSVESVVGRGPALPEVRFLYYLEQGRLLVVLDAPDNAPNDAPETLGMLVDLETGKVRGVDLYGHAPHGRNSKPRLMGLPDGDEEVEGRWGSVHGTDTAGGSERLVVAQVIEQRLHEQPQEGPQAILVLLYESNRLAVMTLRSFELHTQIMEEISYDRRIGDMPLAATALPNPNPRSGAFHVVVSYASSVVRWWTVSLHQCRLQSHQLMSAPTSQLAVCRWSSTEAHTSAEPVKAPPMEAAAVAPAPPQRKEAGVTPTARSSYGGSRQVSQLELLGSPKAAHSPSLAGSRLESPWPLSPRSPRRLTLPKSQSTTDGGLLTRPRPSLCLPRLSRDFGVGAGLGPSIITMSGNALLEAGPYSVTPRGSRFGGATSTAPGNSPQPAYLPDLEADFGFHQMSLLLVAADTTGHLTFYIAQNGKITKVYSCPDLCPHGSSRHKISQLACSERGVLVLWSNGDLRQVEFTLCEKVVKVLDIPFEATHASCLRTLEA